MKLSKQEELFAEWCKRYVVQHGIEKGCSNEVYQRDHYESWRLKAEELGLVLTRDHQLLPRNVQ